MRTLVSRTLAVIAVLALPVAGPAVAGQVAGPAVAGQGSPSAAQQSADSGPTQIPDKCRKLTDPEERVACLRETQESK